MSKPASPPQLAGSQPPHTLPAADINIGNGGDDFSSSNPDSTSAAAEVIPPSATHFYSALGPSASGLAPPGSPTPVRAPVVPGDVRPPHHASAIPGSARAVPEAGVLNSDTQQGSAPASSATKGEIKHLCVTCVHFGQALAGIERATGSSVIAAMMVSAARSNDYVLLVTSFGKALPGLIRAPGTSVRAAMMMTAARSRISALLVSNYGQALSGIERATESNVVNAGMMKVKRSNVFALLVFNLG